jgi:hypothetical protein
MLELESNCLSHLSQMLKRNLILNVILNANLEISNQTMVANTIKLNTNHNKTQQSHAKFGYVIKKSIFYE